MDTPGMPPLDQAASVELVRVGRDGDDAAVNELFRRYWPRLLRVVRIKLGPSFQRRIDPDDVVQEASMIAVSKFDRFDVHTSASILAWLSRIADHVIQNKLRTIHAEKRNPEREVPMSTGDDSEAGVVLPWKGPTASQQFSRQEIEAQVDACISRLDPDAFRQVILLRDYCGLGWEEVREELDRPSVDAVRELHRRARARLAEGLRTLGLDD